MWLGIDAQLSQLNKADKMLQHLDGYKIGVATARTMPNVMAYLASQGLDITEPCLVGTL
jgi:hypothetical protein